MPEAIPLSCFDSRRWYSHVPVIHPNFMNAKTFQSIGLAALLVGGSATALFASDSSTNLSAAEIIRQARAKYASLKSYRDEGLTIATLGTNIAASYTFNIKLARTNLFQIIWWPKGQVFTPQGVVWSAGDGNYLWMSNLAKPQQEDTMEGALGGATGISGGAAASIPGTFFDLAWGNQLNRLAALSTRKPDDKVGDEDCYVLTHGTGGRTNTLWIGKKDFLIHQIENDTSGALIKKMMEEQAAKNPQLRAMIEAGGTQLFQDSRSVETHQEIVINPPLKKTDFDYHVPAPSKP